MGTLSTTLSSGETVQVSIDNGATWQSAAATVGGSAWSIPITLVSSNTLKVRVVDAGSNAGVVFSQGYTLDTTPPTVPSPPVLGTLQDTGASAADGITSITTPTLTGLGDAGSLITLYDTNGTTVLGSALTSIGGTYSITSATLAQGDHTLTVKATDVAGNTTIASTALVVTIDTAAPVVNFASPTATVYTPGQTITGTVADATTVGATITLSEGSTQLGTATVQAGGAWSVPVTIAGLGPHTITASLTDLAGNAGHADATYTLALAPPTPPTPPTSGSTKSVTQPTIVAVDGAAAVTKQMLTGALPTAGADQVVMIKDGEVVLATAKTDAAGKFTLPITYDGYGPVHTYQLTASTLAADGSTITSQPFPYTIDFTPNQPLFGAIVGGGGEASSVYALYKSILGRVADPLGLEGYTANLEAGRSLADVAASLLASPERGPGPSIPSDFVQSLYQNLLGRSADSAGLSYFTDQLARSVSQASVAMQVATSAEAQQVLAPTFAAGVFVPDASEAGVARLYYGLLGRTPDAGGLAAYSAYVETGGGGVAGEAARFVQAAGSILASAEYQAKHAGESDGALVSGLYANALGRGVDAAGASFYESELSAGVSRSVVALQIAGSPEAQIRLVGFIEAGYHLTA